MRYRVVITEMNIDQQTHPEAFRYVLEAETEADAVLKGREMFAEQTGESPRSVQSSTWSRSRAVSR
jgi:hypothetical protein